MTQAYAVTHVGSLPRPQAVVDCLFAQDAGPDYDAQQFERTIAQAVDDVVQRQVAAGIDVVSDGEMSKMSYATYIRHRFTGFEIGLLPRAVPKDLDDFPEFKDRLARLGATPKYHRPICTGPIAVKDLSGLHRDIANLKEACRRHGAKHAFMNSASPGVVAVFQPNQHYASQDDYLLALAEALRQEYEAIVSAGLDLQVDAPDLAMGRHIRFRDASDEEFLRNAHLQVEAMNHALRNIDPARVRMHICWGNYEGPHHHDVALDKILPVVLKARAGTLVFESANPRHAHEWEIWAECARRGLLGDHRKLAPGVLDSTNNFIEHPRLVAQRLETYGRIVGPDRVLAATDCGFGTFAGFGAVHPPITWAKLASMAEGARMARNALSGTSHER